MEINIFTRKSTRVLRVLLVNYGKDWNERQLARDANVSHVLVHFVFKKLLEMKLATKNEQNRFVLTDPLDLLRQWASYHRYDLVNKFLSYSTKEREIDLFFGKLASLDLEYSLSGLVAAWLVAPSLRPKDFHLYVSSEDTAAKIARKIELNPMSMGGNVKFVLPYDEGVFYGTRVVLGVKVVSNVQLYVDLYNAPSRGGKPASKILEQVLKEWQEEKEIQAKA